MKKASTIFDCLDAIGTCNAGRSILHRDKVHAERVRKQVLDGVDPDRIPVLRAAISEKRDCIDRIWQRCVADMAASELCGAAKAALTDALMALERATQPSDDVLAAA